MDVLGGTVNAIQLVIYAIKIVSKIHRTYSLSGIRCARIEQQLAHLDRIDRVLKRLEKRLADDESVCREHPELVENLRALKGTLDQVQAALELEIKNRKRNFVIQLCRDTFSAVHREHLKHLVGQLEADERSLLVTGVFEIHTHTSNMNRFFRKIKGSTGNGSSNPQDPNATYRAEERVPASSDARNERNSPAVTNETETRARTGNDEVVEEAYRQQDSSTGARQRSLSMAVPSVASCTGSSRSQSDVTFKFRNVTCVDSSRMELKSVGKGIKILYDVDTWDIRNEAKAILLHEFSEVDDRDELHEGSNRGCQIWNDDEGSSASVELGA